MFATKTTKVRDILANVSIASDYGAIRTIEDWKTLLRWKLSDPQIPELIRKILAEGFDTPIHLITDSPYVDGWQLGNGHHRLCVAILLGLDEVLTTPYSSDSGYSDYVYANPEDWKGAEMLRKVIDYGIDWENWPKRTF